ncbi:hypothetical protein [Cupriavidus plantarum]|uniref:hypothetical protein n=1 Tax=Cupriavidus plantarum TaxID=942865 RepID=UPI00339D381E
MQKNKISFAGLTTLAALALSACGGGGGDAPAPQQPGNNTPPAPVITVSGSAPAVAADPLAVVVVPQGSTSTKSVAGSISAANFPAQLQKATPEGGYTQFGVDSNSLVILNTGKVVEVTGNGDFAVGRWTDGGSSVGGISINQGTHYAVGKPLKLLQDITLQPDLTLGPKLSCIAIASTSPTAVGGNFAPGKLNSAVATISMSGPTVDSFTLDVAIGSDAHATATVTGVMPNALSISNGVLYHLQSLGTSQASPYLALGYAMPTPSSGDVSGVVVLKCQ